MNQGKKQELKNLHHTMILEAASRLFAQKGYSAVSFDEIALEAKLVRRTLYNHFTDKLSLFQSLCEPLLMTAIENLRKVRSESPLKPDAVWNYLLDLYDEFGSTLSLMRQIRWTELSKMAVLHERFTADFCELFRELSEHRSLRLDPEHSALLVFKTFGSVCEALPADASRNLLFKAIMQGMLFTVC